MADNNVNPGSETLLFLTDEQLRKGIEAMFFAYRGFTADPDRILANYEYGRLLAQDGRPAEARLYFNRAYMEQPDNETYQRSLKSLSNPDDTEERN